jgi:hypothetical protein
MNSRTISRHAIEALRAGVPNRHAVRLLGCTQAAIEQAFRRQLAAAAAPGDIHSTPGLLVTGDFGTGKSHLFEYFQELAVDNNFVASKIVVSKETPLYDPGKLFRAAIESARVPGRIGDSMTEIVAALRTHGPAFDRLLDEVEALRLSSQFAATLAVMRHRQSAQETADRIRRFWGGEKLGTTEIKRFVREIGAGKDYVIEPLSASDLAHQLFLFAPLLIRAAGFAGWVLLADEAELIGRYGILQRGRSYGEIAHLLGRLEDASLPGLFAVVAMTADFAGEVIDRRRDDEKVPARLRARDRPGDALLASQAERGMAIIQKEARLLAPPDQDTVDTTYRKVRQLYGEAHGWDPPDIPVGERGLTTRMRQFVKSWITEWDLRRLDPRGPVTIAVDDMASDYSEQPDIERPSEETAEDA